MANASLRPLSPRTLHLCIDMQLLFAKGGPWATPWMPRVLPVVQRIAGRFPERTIFSRFIPPCRPEDLPGTWQRYYERWREVTRERLDERLLRLVPELEAFVPPAEVVDKWTYSAFATPDLPKLLAARGADGLIVTGSETDVCVLATVLGAIDAGVRVILVKDAVCSSSDEGHDALITMYHERFKEQLEIAESDEVLAAWPDD